MRQVFTSARLENVEAVAQMLRDQGVEVRISNGRSYRSAIRGNFSYRDSGGTAPVLPAVWVLRADQQPLARQVLRDAGLLQSGRGRDDSFLPPNLRFATADISVTEKRQRNRLRYTLLASIAALAGLVLVSTRPQRGDAPVATSSTSTPTSAPASASPLIAAPTQYRVATPPALAEHLFARALTATAIKSPCLAIDDADPSAELVARLGRGTSVVRPASMCAGDAAATLLHVLDYRTDGSGRGTVALRMRAPGNVAPREERLPVARDGDLWRVLDSQ